MGAGSESEGGVMGGVVDRSILVRWLFEVVEIALKDGATLAQILQARLALETLRQHLLYNEER